MATSGVARHPRQRLIGSGGLTHDLDLRIALQEAPNTLTHELMVIEKKDSDCHGPLCQRWTRSDSTSGSEYSLVN